MFGSFNTFGHMATSPFLVIRTIQDLLMEMHVTLVVLLITCFTLHSTSN